MAGDAVTPAKNSLESGRVVRRRVSKFTSADKENFNVFGGNVGETQRKSPLPVGYPRRPLHDITAVLQSLDDQDDVSSRPRKPFTRSQMGLCTQSFELVETNGQSESETGLSKKKSKGKGTGQTATKTSTSMKTTKTVRTKIDLHHIHDQDNRDPNVHMPSEKKTKTVTFADGEFWSLNVELEVPLPTLPNPSMDKTLSSCVEMTDAEEPSDKSREESNVSALAMSSAEGNQPEAKPETSAASSIDWVKATRPHIPKTKPAGLERSDVNLRTRNQLTQGQKKQNPLSSRSSVVKFR